LADEIAEHYEHISLHNELFHWTPSLTNCSYYYT